MVFTFEPDLNMLKLVACKELASDMKISKVSFDKCKEADTNLETLPVLLKVYILKINVFVSMKKR